MRIEQPGPITPRITLTGRSESCVYLADGGGGSSSRASGYFLPREVVRLVLGQMTRFIAKQVEDGK